MGKQSIKTIQKVSGLLLILTGALLVVACGGGSTATDTSAATATPAPTPSPSATPTPGGTPTPTPATPSPTPAPTSVYRLVGSYDKTECVFDSSTGLTWEGKPTSGPRAYTNQYSNFDNPNLLQKNLYGTHYLPTLAEIDASTNTIGYVNEVNRTGLCGYSDWRVPSLSDLLTINTGASLTPIRNLTDDMKTWFPNLFSNGYWTSTPDATYAYGAYTFSLGASGHYQQTRSELHPVRLVR